MNTQDLPSRPGLIVLLLCLSLSLAAQVRGISYTLGPTVNYSWFNTRSGLDDALMIGGRLGIGFGEFVELRGLYMQTLGQSTDLSEFAVDENLLAGTDVDLRRYGAELKLNLSRGQLLPYLTLGAGVQQIERQGLERGDNIFASAGLGLTLSAGDRFTFSLEGKNTAYNYSAVRSLLNAAERQAQNLNLDDFPVDRFGNWSLGASANFYLGGRRPGELSEVDQAYIDAFGNGFSGLRLPLEVNLARIEWDEALPYRNAWLGGANIGIDFGPFVGLRAFYLRAMDDDKVSLDFDPLSLYGGDVRFKLGRTGRTLTPFLTLGGGYIRVGDEYVARPERAAESQGFATGGGGLVIALGNYVRINGSARALLTSSSEIEDLNTTEQLATSWMYSTGLTVAFGRRARERNTMAGGEIEKEIEIIITDGEPVGNDDDRRARTQALRQRYERRIRELERQLDAAYAADDMSRAGQLLRQKEEAQAVLAEIDSRQEPDPDPSAAQGATSERQGLIYMTPEQFTELVRALRAEERPRPGFEPELMERMMSASERRYRELQARIDRLEAMFRNLQMQDAPPSRRQRAPVGHDSLQRSIERHEMRLERQQLRRSRTTGDSSSLQLRMDSLQIKIDSLRRSLRQEHNNIPLPERDSMDRRRGYLPQPLPAAGHFSSLVSGAYPAASSVLAPASATASLTGITVTSQIFQCSGLSSSCSRIIRATSSCSEAGSTKTSPKYTWPAS